MSPRETHPRSLLSVNQHVRLKRSGAWWYELNSNQMLALRCAKYNGTFDQVFVRYQQRLREA